MIGLYDLVADRLRANCPSLLQVEVGAEGVKAIEMLALGGDVTALVAPISDEARPVSTGTFHIVQTENETFAVVMALVFPGGFPQFETARQEIKTALRGWMPDELALPIEYVGGATLLYDLKREGGRWLHRLRFRAVSQATYGVST